MNACFLRVVLLLVTLHALAGHSAAASVALVLRNPSESALNRWPMTTGVPFPKGALSSGDRVCIEDLSGRPMPVQTRVTSRWDDGSVRWLLVDFQPEITGAPEHVYRLLPNGGNRPPENLPKIKVSESDPDLIVVDTGAISFTVRRDRFDLLHQLTLSNHDAPEVLLEADKESGPYLVGGDGTVYRSQFAAADVVDVEEQGTLRAVIRAEGWLVSDDGERKCRYVVRMHAYAGLPLIRLLYTVIVTEPSETAQFKDIGLTFPVRSASVTFGGGPRGQHPFDKGRKLYLLQYDADKFVVRSDADPCRWLPTGDGTRAPGWVTATGEHGCVSLCVRDFWQQFPKELSVSETDLTFHAWPEHGVAKPDREVNDAMLQYLWFCHEGNTLDFRVPEAYWNHHGQYSENQYRYIRSSRKANVIGLAKTHELVAWFHQPGDAEHVQNAFAAWQNAPVCMADPEWMCRSGVFGRIHPYDPEQFGAIEAALSRAFDCERRLEAHTKDYGIFHFGDGHTVWDKDRERWSDHYRQWRALHHGAPRVPWLLYIRSGDPKYLVHAVRNTRHVMDMDICHFTTDEFAERDYPEGKIVGALNDYKGLVHWHSGSRLFDYNAMTDYLLYYYYMTGDRRGLDVAKEWGESIKARFVKPQGGREGSGVCAALLELAQATRDPEYMRLATLYARHMMNFTQNMRGDKTYSDHVCSYWPEKRGVLIPYGAFPEWENYAPWLQRYYDMTGDPAAEQHIVAWARAYRDDGFGDLCSLWGADEYVNILAYAYFISKDVRYLEHGLRLVNTYVDSVEDAPGTLYDGYPKIGQMSHGAGYMAQRIPYFLEALAEYGGTVTPEPAAPKP